MTATDAARTLAVREKHVLIAGYSTRAAAESAAREGFGVTALDAFADLDQHPAVRSIALTDAGGRFSARTAAAAARDVRCDAVVYLSNFENHPAAVAALAKGRALWGNPPEVLRKARDPLLLAETLRKRGLAVPQVRLKPDTTYGSYVVSGFSRTVKWLVKPLRSGGGHGIRPFDGTLPRGHYLQEQIDGVPGSIVFVAARGRAVPLGISRQLVGDVAFGAAGYQYCGSILTSAEEPLAGSARALASAVTEEFGLVGLNGIDFIERDGVAYPLEVNPRWCASMELVERAYGVSMFAAHAAVCTDAQLPAFDLRAASRRDAAGKAIVFAREDAEAGDTRAWLDDPDVRDVPRPGQRLSKGSPICTVFASGATDAACRATLAARAADVYDRVQRTRPSHAV